MKYSVHFVSFELRSLEKLKIDEIFKLSLLLGNLVHALVAGWGTTGEVSSAPINELFPTQLMNAMVPFVLDADCESDAFYGSLVDTNFVFCAG